MASSPPETRDYLRIEGCITKEYIVLTPEQVPIVTEYVKLLSKYFSEWSLPALNVQRWCVSTVEYLVNDRPRWCIDKNRGVYQLTEQCVKDMEESIAFLREREALVREDIGKYGTDALSHYFISLAQIRGGNGCYYQFVLSEARETTERLFRVRKSKRESALSGDATKSASRK